MAEVPNHTDDSGRFHVHGWHFWREDDNVLIHAPSHREASTFSPQDWASIVAHVADGGSAAAFEAASQLHHRSAITGQYVDQAFAEQYPDTTVTERDS